MIARQEAGPTPDLAIAARNPYRIEGAVVYMELTQGRTTALDVADLPLVAPYRWHAVKMGPYCYAETTERRNNVLMHRLLTDAVGRVTIKHANGDRLDNRRQNLRPAGISIQRKLYKGYEHRYYRATLYRDHGVRVSRLFPYSDAGRRRAELWLAGQRAEWEAMAG